MACHLLCQDFHTYSCLRWSPLVDRICFSSEVTFNHTSSCEISVESPHYYEQQVCALVFWTSHLVCALGGIIPLKKIVEILLKSVVKTSLRLDSLLVWGPTSQSCFFCSRWFSVFLLSPFLNERGSVQVCAFNASICTKKNKSDNKPKPRSCWTNCR